MWAQVFNISFMVPEIGIMFTPIQGKKKVVYNINDTYCTEEKWLIFMPTTCYKYQNLEKSVDLLLFSWPKKTHLQDIFGPTRCICEG